jgi:hypothetical protein
MSDTPYSPPKPPKTITKIQEDQFLDFASTYTWVLLFFVAVALVIVYFIGNKAVIGFESKSNIAITGALGIALIIWLVIWIKYFSTSEKVDKQFLLFNFRVKEVKGHLSRCILLRSGSLHGLRCMRAHVPGLRINGRKVAWR